ncbi:type II secretion system F family protein [Oryzihumus sp.]|uniref:type II secretion system F family protein n=1 Tax=Oryzihumus sp. TaxID=1968903 RepID=UPI002ED921B6
MNGSLLFVGAGLFGLGLLVCVSVALVDRAGPSGVARSLALINTGATLGRDTARHDAPAADRLVKPALDGARRLALRLSPSGTAERLARMLDVAGNPPAWSVERVLGAKGLALLVFSVLGLLLGGGLSPQGLVVAALTGTAGFFLPDLLVYNAGVKRQDQLRRGLADALDMLTVCVEAGQGFDSALQQVARSTTGPVAGEFARVLSEIQIGKPRGEAFAALARRTNVAEVKTFITALVQADRLGLPIGAVLREQAVQMRLVRRQRAEEKAQKVPVKILFPMIFCIFPVLMIVVIGPGIIRLVAVFSHM